MYHKRCRKEVVAVDEEHVALPTREEELFIYPFVGEYAIEMLPQSLTCVGAQLQHSIKAILPGKRFKYCSYSKQYLMDAVLRLQFRRETGCY